MVKKYPRPRPKTAVGVFGALAALVSVWLVAARRRK